MVWYLSKSLFYKEIFIQSQGEPLDSILLDSFFVYPLLGKCRNPEKQKQNPFGFEVCFISNIGANKGKLFRLPFALRQRCVERKIMPRLQDDPVSVAKLIIII